MEDGKDAMVWLHVYDLNVALKYLLNTWAFSHLAGLGAFHCGIEVLGAEWSFQADPYCQDDGFDTTGLMCAPPKGHPVHIYRESVCLGKSTLAVHIIWQVLLRLEQKWPAKGYHVVHRNCTDFAEEFVAALAVPEPFPGWVRGIAKGYLIHTPLANTGAEKQLPRSWMSRSVQSESTRSQSARSEAPLFEAPSDLFAATREENEDQPQEKLEQKEEEKEEEEKDQQEEREDEGWTRELSTSGLASYISCVMMRDKDDEEPPHTILLGKRPLPPELPAPPPTPPPPRGSCQQGCFSFIGDFFRHAAERPPCHREGESSSSQVAVSSECRRSRKICQDEACTSRMPVVGDRVVARREKITHDANGNDLTWRLIPGEAATVIEVDNDGDFRLRNPDAAESWWVYRGAFFYAHEEGACDMDGHMAKGKSRM